MTDETPESLIPYDEIVQDALRAVVSRVLREVEQTGTLPGEHHFYITFKTRAPGVSIPKHLLERFPDEMTIVIQHRFWDLKVEEDNFSVGLSFGGVPAMLHVPFAAVTQFHDPAVEFALTFQAAAEMQPDEHEAAENDTPAEEESVADAEPREDGSNVVSVDFTRKK
ncbi:SspB family protein [Sphingomonas flavescens]|uniref:SspB family protein n=1 Tax=Sphingomonas flavescens TaxID=3132797 RepID=UPI002805951C|nr:ClpXP protease specificity-enhancing factor SspB [Sphingomonas limnosediminicola]